MSMDEDRDQGPPPAEPEAEAEMKRAARRPGAGDAASQAGKPDDGTRLEDLTTENDGGSQG